MPITGLFALRPITRKIANCAQNHARTAVHKHIIPLFLQQAMLGVVMLYPLCVPSVFICMHHFTMRLHVMQCPVLLLQFCPSVRCVYCDKTE